jgi:hypothetical protein
MKEPALALWKNISTLRKGSGNEVSWRTVAIGILTATNEHTVRVVLLTCVGCVCILRLFPVHIGMWNGSPYGLSVSLEILVGFTRFDAAFSPDPAWLPGCAGH